MKCSAHVGTLTEPNGKTAYPLHRNIVNMLKLLLLCILHLALIGCESSEPKPPQHPNPKTTTDVQKSIVVPTNSFLEKQTQNIEDRIDKFTDKPPLDKTYITFGEYHSKKPVTWAWVPPRSQLVTVNYVVPSTRANEHALFSITEFPDGDNGYFDENIARWKAQFRSNDGSPMKPKVESLTTNKKYDASIVEFEGEYMGAGAAWHLQNHSLLVANIRLNDSNWHFKLLGSTNTVKAHRKSFISFLKEISKLPPSQE